MARHDATMAVVSRSGGRWRPSQIVGVISREHIADSVSEEHQAVPGLTTGLPQRCPRSIVSMRLGLGGPPWLVLLLRHGFLECLDAARGISHEFGDLSSTEQEKNYRNNDNPMPKTFCTHDKPFLPTERRRT
jgi:hypothetical protein